MKAIVWPEIINAIDKITDYLYKDEKKHYEEIIDRKVTEDEMINPDLLKNKSHIFYHILLLNSYINQ